MKQKFYIHVFVSGKNIYPGATDTIGCCEINRGWELTDTDITVRSVLDKMRYRWTFAPGNRFYIVENHGQCQEPNGNIIWRNEDGAFGDEKAVA